MKKSPFALFDAATGAQLRALIRTVTVGVTAFWAKLDVAQVAAVQVMLEGVLAVFVASPLGDTVPEVAAAAPVVCAYAPQAAPVATPAPFAVPPTTIG